MYLQWQDESRQMQRREMSAAGLRIGRAPENEICLPLAGVSWQHARIDFRDGSFMAVDRGSTNGTRCNGQPLAPHAPVLLQHGDRLAIGDTELVCRAPDAEQSAFAAVGAAWAAPKTQVLSLASTGAAQTLIAGRDPACDVPLDASGVSWHHARFTLRDGGWLLEDLGSANGTFVNEQRVERAFICSSDRVRIGLDRFQITAGQVAVAAEGGQIRLDALHLTRAVSKDGRALTLLDDVSLRIQPRELVAIVGASGAGKTTLLLALNGYQPATSGQVLLNGIDFYAAPDLFRTAIGYVPQADIVHGELTVESALRYAARLRLPGDTRDAEIAAMVTRTLEELELAHRSTTPVRALSGGERKRVNIGVELLTRPSILFLDEPTTGLDAGLERRVTRQLRDLAREGRTIVAVTHSVQTLDEYDTVVWMARGGRLAYCGPPREAPRFFGVADYAAVYDLMNATGADTVSIATQGKSPYFSVASRPAEPAGEAAFFDTTRAAPASVSPPARLRRSAWQQMAALTRRYVEIIGSDSRNLAIWMAQVPLIALIVAFLFKAGAFASGQTPDEKGNLPVQDGPRLMFLLALSMTCFGLCNACREIVKEKAVYHRERHVALQIGPYIGSKLLVLGGVAVCQSLFLLLAVSLKINLHLEPARLLLTFAVLSAGSVMAVVIGLWVSARASSPDQAITLVALILLMQVIFSGLIPLEQMNGVFGALACLSSMRWLYGGLCGGANIADRWRDAGLGSQVQDVFRTSPLAALAILLTMLALTTLALCFTLAARDRRRD